MSRVNIDLKDPGGVYSISCVEGTKALMPLDEDEDEDDPKSRVHTLSVVVPMGKTADFTIEFNPSLVGRMVGEIRLTVVDNPYEESTIQLIGEGYQDEVTVDNIRSYVPSEEQAAEVEIDDDTPGAYKGRTIRKVMGEGGGWKKKNKKKFMQGKMSEKKIHARENVRKKNSCTGWASF